LQVAANSGSVALTRSTAKADDDGAAQPPPANSALEQILNV
jgi:hypothetical protein